MKKVASQRSLKDFVDSGAKCSSIDECHLKHVVLCCTARNNCARRAFCWCIHTRGAEVPTAKEQGMFLTSLMGEAKIDGDAPSIDALIRMMYNLWMCIR